MITVPNEKVLFALPRTPIDGELATCTDSKQTYVGKNGAWERIDAKSSVSMSLYDINKSTMFQMKSLNLKKRLEAVEIIKEFCGGATSDNYFMLLCRDLNYYTIFPVRNNDANSQTVSSAVLACAEDMGQIVSVERNTDTNSIEIWIKTNDDAYCMFFFDYTKGVIPIKV
jgi:hypothetical protein